MKKYTPALRFNFLTRFYDFVIRFTMPEKIIRNYLISEIDPLKGEKILEFGFGTGQNLILLSNKEPSSDYYGLDIDPNIKEVCQKKLDRHHVKADLRLYEGSVFPFKDNMFNKVYTSLVFHHLTTDQKKESLIIYHQINKC